MKGTIVDSMQFGVNRLYKVQLDDGSFYWSTKEDLEILEIKPVETVWAKFWQKLLKLFQ